MEVHGTDGVRAIKDRYLLLAESEKAKHGMASLFV